MVFTSFSGEISSQSIEVLFQRMAKIDQQQQQTLHLLQFVADGVKNSGVLPPTGPPERITLPFHSQRQLAAFERNLQSPDKTLQLVR